MSLDLTTHVTGRARPEQAGTSDKKRGQTHTKSSSSLVKTEKNDNDWEEKTRKIVFLYYFDIYTI